MSRHIAGRGGRLSSSSVRPATFAAIPPHRGGGAAASAPQPSKTILRVFPRRTRATPDDANVRIGDPGFWDEADEVLVSVAFTWDIPEAERLAVAWKGRGRVRVGGPAMGTVGEDFVPGHFLKHGYTITSRGCPERCWFCGAWKRDGAEARELPIRDGWNVLDDNLLACSEGHIRGVFAMLARQTNRVEFTGGLHAARLKGWHIDLLSGLRRRPVVFLAYDDNNDLEPFIAACRLLKHAGWHRRVLRAYVLCGYPGDTQAAAESRCERVLSCGADPMAMVYRGQDGILPDGWRRWARSWIRPAAMHARQRTEAL